MVPLRTLSKDQLIDFRQLRLLKGVWSAYPPFGRSLLLRPDHHRFVLSAHLKDDDLRGVSRAQVPGLHHSMDGFFVYLTGFERLTALFCGVDSQFAFKDVNKDGTRMKMSATNITGGRRCRGRPWGGSKRPQVSVSVLIAIPCSSG